MVATIRIEMQMPNFDPIIIVNWTNFAASSSACSRARYLLIVHRDFSFIRSKWIGWLFCLRGCYMKSLYVNSHHIRSTTHLSQATAAIAIRIEIGESCEEKTRTSRSWIVDFWKNVDMHMLPFLSWCTRVHFLPARTKHESSLATIRIREILLLQMHNEKTNESFVVGDEPSFHQPCAVVSSAPSLLRLFIVVVLSKATFGMTTKNSKIKHSPEKGPEETKENARKRETIVWNFIVFYAEAIQINFYLRYMFINAQDFVLFCAVCGVCAKRSLCLRLIESSVHCSVAFAESKQKTNSIFTFCLSTSRRCTGTQPYTWNEISKLVALNETQNVVQ